MRSVASLSRWWDLRGASLRALWCDLLTSCDGSYLCLHQLFHLWLLAQEPVKVALEVELVSCCACCCLCSFRFLVSLFILGRLASLMHRLL